MKDWNSWHIHYDDPNSDLALRLKVVQEQISKILPGKLQSRFQIIDICAGDGRDLIPVLAKHPNSSLISSLLVEVDKTLSEASKELALKLNVSNVTLEISDASLCMVYKDVIPADLILLCGVFGNISDTDVKNTISNLSMLCKLGTKIVWTRNRREPDATPKIRKLFIDNGFKELEFIAPDNNTYSIGVSEFKGTPKPFDSNVRLFTFIR